jgi:hypothetical protein
MGWPVTLDTLHRGLDWLDIRCKNRDKVLHLQRATIPEAKRAYVAERVQTPLHRRSGNPTSGLAEYCRQGFNRGRGEENKSSIQIKTLPKFEAAFGELNL